MTEEKVEKFGFFKALKIILKTMTIGEKLKLIFLFVSCLARAAATLLPAQIIACIISKISGLQTNIFGFPIPDSLNIYWLIVILFVFLYLFWTFGVFLEARLEIMSGKIVSRLNIQSLKWILEPRENMNIKMSNGEANYVIKRASESVTHLISTISLDIVPSCIIAVIASVYVAMLDIVAFGILIGTLLALIIAIFIRIRIDNKITEQVEDSNAKINNHVLNSVTNLPLICMLKSQFQELHKLSILNKSYNDGVKKKANVMFVYWAIIMFFEYGGMIAMISVAIMHNTQNLILIPELVILIQYIGEIYNPIEQLGWRLSEIQQDSVKVCRLMKVKADPNELLELKQIIKRSDDELKEFPTNLQIEKIEFKDIQVKLGTYERKNINCTFEKGKMTLIMGPSGTGKTTMVDILCGLKQYQKGEIVVNDRYSINSLFFSNKVSYIMQGSLIFDRSIKENICYPDGVMTKQAEEIIKKLGLQKLIEREVKENAETLNNSLSGGEKKRIELARGLIKEADIYIFDEPTNELDDKNVKIVLRILEKLISEHIVIVVSHDERVEKLAENIIVLEKED